MTVSLSPRTFHSYRYRWFDRWLDRLLRRPPLRIEVGPLSPIQERIFEGLMAQGIMFMPGLIPDGQWFAVYIDGLPPDSPYHNGFYQVSMSWHIPGTSHHSGQA